jgi:hypothetical protein
VNPADFMPPAPEELQAVPSRENVTLIWKESPATWVSGYRIYRETDTKKGFVAIGETQTPAFLDPEKPATKRSYRVTALGPSRESRPAEIRGIVYKEPR